MDLYEIHMTVGNDTYSCGKRAAEIPALIAGALVDGAETITIKLIREGALPFNDSSEQAP